MKIVSLQCFIVWRRGVDDDAADDDDDNDDFVDLSTKEVSCLWIFVRRCKIVG